MIKPRRLLAALLAIQFLLPALTLAAAAPGFGNRAPSCCKGKHGGCCRMKRHSDIALNSTNRCGSECGCDGVVAQDLKLILSAITAAEPVPYRSCLVSSRAAGQPSREIVSSIRPRSPPV